MGFLANHFGRDYSGASSEEIELLKQENERRAVESERTNQIEVDHMPLWLNMTNTTRCNLNCIMCNQAYGKILDLRMEPEIYEQIVREFYPFLRTVQLTAIGEPMMTPQLRSKIEDMLRFGVRLEMVTNGTLMKGDGLLEKLATASELITVSVDGARAETFHSIRPGADFNEILDNIRRFNHFRSLLPEGERPRLNFNYILMKRNIRELPDFVDLAADLDAHTIIGSHLVLYEEGLEEEMLIHDPGLSNAYTAAAQERAAARGVAIQLPPPFPEEGANPSPPVDESVDREKSGEEPGSGDAESAGKDGTYSGEKCYFLWRRVYIGPHGEVVPCCLSGIEALGNLKENSFPEIWNNGRYKRLRKFVHTLNPPAPCKGCYLINRNPDSADFKKI